MRRWLLTLFLVLCFAAPAHALGDAFVLIPSTTVAAVTTTYGPWIDGTYLSRFLAIVTCTDYNGSQTMRIAIRYEHPPTGSGVYRTLDSADAPLAAEGRGAVVSSLPQISKIDASLVASGDRWGLYMPRRVQFSVVTTTSDSVTFSLSIIPLNLQ